MGGADQPPDRPDPPKEAVLAHRRGGRHVGLAARAPHGKVPCPTPGAPQQAPNQLPPSSSTPFTMADAPVRHPAKRRMLQRREESSSPELAIRSSEEELGTIGTPVERSTDDASSSSHSSYREEGLDPDQGDMYDVEAVMGWRLSEAGTPEYLIKWFGFDPADNTWEPAEHLTT